MEHPPDPFDFCLGHPQRLPHFRAVREPLGAAPRDLEMKRQRRQRRRQVVPKAPKSLLARGNRSAVDGTGHSGGFNESSMPFAPYRSGVSC